MSRTFDDINQSKILYDPPPRVMEMKTKVNKWDLINLKSFCTAKATVSKMCTVSKFSVESAAILLPFLESD